MTTRKYDFITGIETSAAPSATDPVAASDPVTLGYADTHYVPGLQTQATITAIKNLATADRTDGDIVFAVDQDVAFRYSSSETATADDFFYLLPVSNVGRWVRVTEFDHATGDLAVPNDITVANAATVTGDLGVTGSATVSTNLTVTGDLTVNGTTTTVNTSTLDVTDANISVNNTGNQATADSSVSGITVTMTDATDAVIGYDSTLASKFKAGDTGSESEIVTVGTAQTISALKTHSADLAMQNTAIFTELGATPANPSAGTKKFYAKNDGKIYTLDSLGSEVEVGAGATSGSGSGEINLIGSPSSAADWAASGAGVTIATTTTASEMPLGDQVITTGLKITPVSGTDYARYRFSMPEALYNTKLGIKWYQEALSGYVAGDFKVELYTNTQPDYLGTYTEVSLSSDVAGTTDVPSGVGRVTGIDFDSNTDVNYELRIVRTSGTTAIVLQSLIVGPGNQATGAVVSEWISYTPTTSGFGTITSDNVYYRRVGSSIEVQGEFTNGTVSATEAQIGLPSGLTIGGATGPRVIGKFDTNTVASDNNHNVLATSSDSFVNISRHNMQATPTNMLLPANGSAISFSTTRVSFFFSVSITQWEGSGNLNLINDSVIHANAKMRAQRTNVSTIANANNVVYEDVDYDTSGAYNNTTGVYTCPAAGKYRVRGMFRFSTTSAGGTIAAIYKNGVAVTQHNQSTQTNNDTVIVDDVISCVKSDTLSIVYIGDANSPAFRSSGTENVLTIVRVSDFSAGDSVGFGLATSSSNGLIKRRKLQTKFLAATYASTTAADILTFNNLIVGNIYTMSVQVFGNFTTTGSTMFIRSGTTEVSRHRVIVAGQQYYQQNVTFVALDTTANFYVTLASGASILGNNTSAFTFATLVEEIDTDETTDFT